MALVVLCDTASPFREACQRALAALGHRVVLVVDGAALATALRGAAPDCVMLDEGALGGIAGLYAAAVRLRTAGDKSPALGPPLLAVIERQEPEARAAALQMVDDVVSRPAHLVEVVARVESLLRARSGAASTTAGFEDLSTGLRSRAYLDERVADEWRRATRFSEPMAMLLVGLDGSSTARASALRDAGAALKRALRQIDVLGRFAGAELAALLVNTHVAGALTCAERLRGELVPAGAQIAMGLSFYPGKDVTSVGELVRTAERARERARAEGPGSICLIQHQGYLFQER